MEVRGVVSKIEKIGFVKEDALVAETTSLLEKASLASKKISLAMTDI
jgi:hypothetical protein